MRIAGIVLTLGLFVLFSALAGALPFLWQPLYLGGVIVLATVVVVNGFGFRTALLAGKAAVNPAKLDKASLRKAAAVYAGGRKTVIVLGWVLTIFGTIAVLAGQTPPDVRVFSEALSGGAYGMLLAYAVCLPLEKALHEMSEED